MKAGTQPIFEETTIFTGACKAIRVSVPSRMGGSLHVHVEPLHAAGEWDSLGSSSEIYSQEYRGQVKSVRVKPGSHASVVAYFAVVEA